MKNLICSYLVLMLLIVVVVEPSNAKEAMFDDAVTGFTIDVPDEWTIEHPPGGGSEYIPALFVNSPDGGSSDSYIENLTVGIVVMPTKVDKISLKKKMDGGDKLIKSAVRNFKVHSVSSESIDGMPADVRIKSWIFPQNNEPVKQFNVTIAHNNILYYLVFSSTPSEFHKHEEAFRNMAATFRKSK